MSGLNNNVPAMQIASHLVPMYDDPDLIYLLRFFNPETIEQKFALSEAYVIANDFDSSKMVLQQLRGEVIDAHNATDKIDVQRMCRKIIQCIDDNLYCIALMLEKTIMHEKTMHRNFMTVPPGGPKLKREALLPLGVAPPAADPNNDNPNHAHATINAVINGNNIIHKDNADIKHVDVTEGKSTVAALPPPLPQRHNHNHRPGGLLGGNPAAVGLHAHYPGPFNTTTAPSTATTMAPITTASSVAAAASSLNAQMSAHTNAGVGVGMHASMFGRNPASVGGAVPEAILARAVSNVSSNGCGTNFTDNESKVAGFPGVGMGQRVMVDADGTVTVYPYPGNTNGNGNGTVDVESNSNNVCNTNASAINADNNAAATGAAFTASTGCGAGMGVGVGVGAGMDMGVGMSMAAATAAAMGIDLATASSLGMGHGMSTSMGASMGLGMTVDGLAGTGMSIPTFPPSCAATAATYATTATATAPYTGAAANTATYPTGPMATYAHLPLIYPTHTNYYSAPNHTGAHTHGDAGTGAGMGMGMGVLQGEESENHAPQHTHHYNGGMGSGGAGIGADLKHTQQVQVPHMAQYTHHQ